MHLPIFFRCFLPNFLPDFLPYDLPYVLPNPSLSYLSLSPSTKSAQAREEGPHQTGNVTLALKMKQASLQSSYVLSRFLPDVLPKFLTNFLS
jgi:hypothetical protein